AVKANDDLPLVKLLYALGCSFDCASVNEMKTVFSFGVKPEEIIYANPVKQIDQLLFAKENGVKKLVADNEAELKKLQKFYPECEVVIRLLVDDSQSVCQFSSKFGCSLNKFKELIK